MIKPPCGHTKYEGSAPCICSQFETYWREQIAQEIEAISYWGYEEYGIRYISQPDAAAIARGQK